MSELEEIEARIQDLLDDSTSSEERAILVDDLKGNAEARRIYLDYVYLEIALEFAQAEICPSSVGKVIPMDKVLARQKRKTFRVAMIAAVVVCLIGAASLMFMKLPKSPLARFKTSPQTEFSLTHVIIEGAEAPANDVMEIGSRIRLTKGAMELELGSGVKAIVRAPSDFIVQSESLLDFSYGSAWFVVSPKAVGFQVSTPEYLLTDLGTEFGVISKPDLPDEVHVFLGKVRVERHDDSGQSDSKGELQLLAGEARATAPDGRWEEIQFGAEGFFRELPEVDLLPPHLYWSFDQVDKYGELATRGTLPEAREVILKVGSAAEGPVTTEGKVRGGLKFDQYGDSLESNWQGIMGNKPRSIAFWLKLRPGTGKYDARLLWWGKRSSSGNESTEWSVRATSFDYSNPATARTEQSDETRIQLFLGGSWWMGESVIIPDKWYHVAICYGAELDKRGRPVADFYLNGRPEKSRHSYSSKGFGKPINTLPGPGANLVIGRSRFDPSQSCDASFDELYIFDSKLSPEAVRALANP